MRQRVEVREEPDDAELAARATTGDLAAFEELYRRHVEAAWRMALAVTSNPHDAADAVSDAFTRVFQTLPDRPHAAGHFRPYLLAAVRNAAIDGLRRGGRQRAANAGDHADRASVGAGPGERLEADVEAALVSRAFRSLPERWRSVLWLTEVEGIAARDVATLLDMTPNGVAQLAVRARAGLRQRYLQAHLRQSAVHTSCRDTFSRLGAYAAGGLAPRDIAKVDQHLAACEACRSRLAQLQEVTPCLHRAVLPLPASIAILSAAKLHLAAGGTAVGAAAASAVPASVGAGLLVGLAPAPLMATVASAALLVAGFVGAGVVRDRSERAAPPVVATSPPPAVTPSFEAASSPPAADATAGGDPVAGLVDGVAGGADLSGVTGLVDRLGQDLARLSAAAPALLEAAAQGKLRIDVGAAAADIDLREGSQACPSFRVLDVNVSCAEVTVPGTAAPTEPVLAPPADLALAEELVAPGEPAPATGP